MPSPNTPRAPGKRKHSPEEESPPGPNRQGCPRSPTKSASIELCESLGSRASSFESHRRRGRSTETANSKKSVRIEVEQNRHLIVSHLVVKLPDPDCADQESSCEERAKHVKKYLLQEKAELLVILRSHIKVSRRPYVWIQGEDQRLVGKCAEIIKWLLLSSDYDCEICPDPGEGEKCKTPNQCKLHSKELMEAWESAVGR